MMKLFSRKTTQKSENLEQNSIQSSNNSTRTDSQNSQLNPNDSIQSTTSDPNKKGFFKRLLGNLNTSKNTSKKEPEKPSPTSSPNITPGRSALASAKREASQDSQRLARLVLREVHQQSKEDFINRMIEDEEIESEEQAQAAEEDMDNEFYEEYGNILNDDGDDEDNQAGEDEDNEDDFDDEYEFENQQGVAQNQKEDYPDEEGGYEYEEEPEQSKEAEENSNSRKQQDYERRIATETTKPKSNHFSIEEGTEEDPNRQYQSRSEPNDVYISKGKRRPPPKTEVQVKKRKEDIYEVYRNKFSYQTTTNEEFGINYFYSKDEQINLKGLKYYEVNRNAFASGLTNLIKKVTRYLFIIQKNFYVAKKTTGNFAVIESSYPLSRLAKIYIHDKAKVLKFSFYDDEILGFNLIDEKFRSNKCNEIVAEVSKNLQGINSSIRILQSGQSFE